MGDVRCEVALAAVLNYEEGRNVEAEVKCGARGWRKDDDHLKPNVNQLNGYI